VDADVGRNKNLRDIVMREDKNCWNRILENTILIVWGRNFEGSVGVVKRHSHRGYLLALFMNKDAKEIKGYYEYKR
jgi:hypothetical protein